MPRAGEAGHGRGAVVLFGTCLPYVSICPFPPNVEGVAVVGVVAAIEGRLAALVCHEGSVGVTKITLPMCLTQE